MKTIFNKTLIHVAVATAVLSSTAYAQAETEAHVEADLEQIIVTANRSQQEQFLALSATQVIGQNEIKAIQPQNITELLNTVAGVTVTNLGGAGQSSSVFMRGTNGNHTLVLVDGVRVGSATLGTTSFASMSVALIDRIEIVKGPRGALWGSDAIGGVIQIFTKKLQSGEGFISAGFGSHGYWKTEAAAGFGNEKHSLTIAGALEESDGFNASDFSGQEDKDGYERQSFSINGRSELTEEYSLNLVSRYEQGGSQYDNQYGGADENEHENYSVKLGGVYETQQLFIDTSLSTSQDQGGTFAGNISPKVVNEITTKRDQLALLAQYSLNEKTSVSAGFDWFKERVSNSGSEYDKDSRQTKAFFVQGRHQVESFLLEAAVRSDNIDGLDNEVTYNLSAGYQLNDDWLISLSQSTGFKAPTFNDLYWPGSGNPDLAPEEVESTELLIRNHFDLGSVEVSIYDSEIKNLIAWAPNKEGNWFPANVDSATAQGIDLTAILETGDFSHQLAAAYVETEDESTGKQLLRRPKVSATYTLAYQVDALTANAILDYRGKSEDNKYSTVTLNSVLLTNLTLSYEFTNKLSVIGKINNLFDKEYTVAEHYLTDGINYQLMATYTF
ncbi:TonB-dependent receptor domain-containing protein [Colwellia sp. RSH04]|uniref:TonB-dependent receptor domain-containing protein n=1 Tax=Colwellia sp. RSH04 TaxID=2305464 RepID=UPI000E58BD7C|nr:TonB-dependent receptor [Colwellia sp. RSH04]RHW75871.1 TonB-dependent receptor [Colwellia sp. RSH04]